jgi:hypothetical protein
MLRALEISASSLLRLTEPIDDHVRDCFSISRSILETAVNLTYIAAMGDEFAERAPLHSLQRSVQDLERGLTIGGLEFHHRARALDNPDEVPGLRSEIERLARAETERSMSQRWTLLSVPQRITAVIEQFDMKVGGTLAHAYFYIYANASEILHGSVYGCLLSPEGTIRERDVARHDHAITLLLASGMVINEAITAIGTVHRLGDVMEVAKVYFGAFGRYLPSIDEYRLDSRAEDGKARGDHADQRPFD